MPRADPLRTTWEALGSTVVVRLTDRGALRQAGVEIEAALDVLRSRSLFRYYGPDLQHCADRFEQDLASTVGTRHAIAVSSGTAALACGLVGLGMPAGAEVIIPALTFVGCVNAISWSRGVPVIAAVDDTLTLDPTVLDALVTDRTFAIMPVHLGNVAADLDAILAVARRHGLRVLEDCAQAAGVTYRGRRVGAIGDAGAFSFQLDKNITAGEEITYDYCLYDGGDDEATCNCGAKKCRGTMYSREEIRRRKAVSKKAALKARKKVAKKKSGKRATKKKKIAKA